MTKLYLKRLKGNWRQGKRYKGDGVERQYAKEEIRKELAMAEDDYLEKHHKGARTKNHLARLEYRVKLYEDTLARHGSDSLCSYLRSGLQEAKKALKKHLKEEV